MQAPPQQPPLLPAPTDQQALPAPPPPKWHDVTIVTKKSYECARVEAVPPEEFGIERTARGLSTCGYCFHEVIRRQIDLIAQGYDEDQVKGLPSWTGLTNTEEAARDTVNENSAQGGDHGANDALREVQITEHYIRIDYEGTGKPKLYRVTTAGGQGDILIRDGEPEIIEEEIIPFAAMTPVIITHRFFGRSVADLVLDIQRIKTALVRGLLDNLYLHNNPRVEVGEDGVTQNTIPDLLESRPGGLIRTKRVGSLAWQEVPDVTQAVYPALQYFDATREWRTGVSRQGQGVDPNALQNQVATIANQMFTASQAKMKLIARIFAETGIKDLFQLLHGVIRKNGSKPDTVRLRNQWVDVDPRDWKERNDLTVRVGLGTGSKAEQIAQTQMLAGVQKEAVAAGLVSKKNLYNTGKHLTKLLGHKDPDEYFVAPDQNDPSATQPIPMPPDPKQGEIQAKLAAEQAKAQADAQHQNARLQLEATLEGQKTKAQLEIQQQLAAIKAQQIQMEMERDRQKHEMEMQKAALSHQHATEVHQMKLQGQHIDQAITLHKEGQAQGAENTRQQSSDHHTAGLSAGLTALAHGQSAMAAALEKLHGPKRISKGKDGSWVSE